MKTFEFKTLGCKVNQYESQSLRERLLQAGLREADTALADINIRPRADIYVVNTCAVTRKAERESAEAVRRLSRLNPKGKIFVTGCSAHHNPDGLKLISGVACVLGNKLKENLPDFIFNSYEGQGKPPSGGKPLISAFYKHTRAFLKIQDGCNNGCSYCIIPKLRGSSRSRPLSEITQEAKILVDNGYRELVLCGICLGAYGADLGLSEGLVRAIGELEKIAGLLRIRLSSIEAREVTLELIKAIAHSKKICRHLHIPFQSGDDKVLRLMNRKVLSGGYRQLIQRLREFLPFIGITTDIIVGFPGEDAKSFAKTFEFLKEVKPSRMHIFSFSPRENTAAFQLPAQRARPQVVKERQEQLRVLAKELSLAFCRVHLGRTLEVLIESGSEPSHKLELSQGEKFSKGYSGNYIKVFIQRAEQLMNTIVTVKPIKIYHDGLLAVIIRPASPRQRQGMARGSIKALTLT
ncbi:MAG: tRNA (N(6)-L-threonylcarbamoyladenosine(37)-C(2))-methylthiotransferase MtaB [Omnitrophica WOR_2 bacterium RIFCSPHIGHO2_02_FULL_45_21]|nr:MAG: tRNA (N(6)-L-threonylcarbamoyladenosine(37)-C(2))-methylthiotransferase MtaB [Omnitrophica WOR_2 bacterium RIFCSPHIGHO2_02_FULL_45_21]